VQACENRTYEHCGEDLEGATRTFPARNLRGAVLQCALWLGVLVGFCVAAQLVGNWFRRMVGARRNVL
jgi:hypothetical protein